MLNDLLGLPLVLALQVVPAYCPMYLGVCSTGLAVLLGTLSGLLSDAAQNELVVVVFQLSLVCACWVDPLVCQSCLVTTCTDWLSPVHGGSIDGRNTCFEIVDRWLVLIVLWPLLLFCQLGSIVHTFVFGL